MKGSIRAVTRRASKTWSRYTCAQDKMLKQIEKKDQYDSCTLKVKKITHHPHFEKIQRSIEYQSYILAKKEKKND